jgi:hypothetical protein
MGSEAEGRQSRDRDRGHPRIVVAGSRSLPPRAALPLLRYILRFRDPVVLMRKGIVKQKNDFETACCLICQPLDIPIEFYAPSPGGRDEVYYRDIEMVSKADLVICIFSAHQPMEGGTAHVVEKAQDRQVPVYAYTYDDENGTWDRLGEWDPADAWTHNVPEG